MRKNVIRFVAILALCIVVNAVVYLLSPRGVSVGIPQGTQEENFYGKTVQVSAWDEKTRELQGVGDPELGETVLFHNGGKPMDCDLFFDGNGEGAGEVTGAAGENTEGAADPNHLMAVYVTQNDGAPKQSCYFSTRSQVELKDLMQWVMAEQARVWTEETDSFESWSLVLEYGESPLEVREFFWEYAREDDKDAAAVLATRLCFNRVAEGAQINNHEVGSLWDINASTLLQKGNAIAAESCDLTMDVDGDGQLLLFDSATAGQVQETWNLAFGKGGLSREKKGQKMVTDRDADNNHIKWTVYPGSNTANLIWANPYVEVANTRGYLTLRIDQEIEVRKFLKGVRYQTGIIQVSLSDLEK